MNTPPSHCSTPHPEILVRAGLPAGRLRRIIVYCAVGELRAMGCEAVVRALGEAAHVKRHRTLSTTYLQEKTRLRRVVHRRVLGFKAAKC